MGTTNWGRSDEVGWQIREGNWMAGGGTLRRDRQAWLIHDLHKIVKVKGWGRRGVGGQKRHTRMRTQEL